MGWYWGGVSSSLPQVLGSDWESDNLINLLTQSPCHSCWEEDGGSLNQLSDLHQYLLVGIYHRSIYPGDLNPCAITVLCERENWGMPHQYKKMSSQPFYFHPFSSWAFITLGINKLVWHAVQWTPSLHQGAHCSSIRPSCTVSTQSTSRCTL